MCVCGLLNVFVSLFAYDGIIYIYICINVVPSTRLSEMPFLQERRPDSAFVIARVCSLCVESRRFRRSTSCVVLLHLFCACVVSCLVCWCVPSDMFLQPGPIGSLGDVEHVRFLLHASKVGFGTCFSFLTSSIMHLSGKTVFAF